MPPNKDRGNHGHGGIAPTGITRSKLSQNWYKLGRNSYNFSMRFPLYLS
ncbi:hypothetical protein QUA04_02075 [Microcoleus sp. S13_C5]